MLAHHLKKPCDNLPGIQAVTWEKGGSVIGQGNPFSFEAKVKELQAILGKAKVTEAKTSPTAKPATFDLSAKTQTSIGRLIAYPGEGYVFPASYPILLQARADAPNAQSITWYFAGQEVGVGAQVTVHQDLVAPGKHLIKAVLPSLQASEEVNIEVFPWTIEISPQRDVVLWESASTTVPISLQATLAGFPIASGSSLNIGNAQVTVESLILKHRADPKENVDYSGLSAPGSGTCRFIKPASFAIRSAILLAIIQQDGSTATFAPQPVTSLFGAVNAKAEYSFSFEPIRAIVGMTREFTVGSITLTLDQTKIVIEDEIPTTFQTPYTLVKALFSGQDPIQAVGFSHLAGFKELPNGSNKLKNNVVDKLEIFFPRKHPVKAYWVPKLQTDAKEDFTFHETSKVIIPKTLDEILAAKIEIEPSTVGINKPTTAKYLFGITSDSLTNQKSLLFPSEKDPDITISLETVTWKLFSSATFGDPTLPDTDATIQVSRTFPGTYTCSAIGSFSATPHEINGPADGLLKAPEKIFRVSGGFLAWEVIPDRPDHLERIASVTSANTWDEIYKKNGHWVWRKKNEILETQPLAVAIASQLTLVPKLGARPETISYLWLNGDLPIMQGNVEYSENGIQLKTPEKIGQYRLILECPGFPLFEIPVVFAIYRIDPNSNFQRIYFKQCLSDATKALEGKTASNQIRELIDSFYDWWWNKQARYKYYIEAINTSQVVSQSGGMCQGLGNYFYKTLESIGLPGETSQTLPRLRRIGFNLIPDNPIKQNSNNFVHISKILPGFRCTRAEDIPYSPIKPEYFGGILIVDPGLNRSEVVSDFPIVTSSNAYASTPISVQSKSYKKIPPRNLLASLYPDEEDLVIANRKAYCFFIAFQDGSLLTDGHAFVILEEDNKYLLYDPSFGKNRFRGVSIGKFDLPENLSDYSKRPTIISSAGEIRLPEFWDYLKASVLYWRSNTYCNLSKMTRVKPWKRDPSGWVPIRRGSALRIIDTRSNEVNYLRLLLVSYTSMEDSK